jgi:CRISPR-associated protein Cmr3
MTLQHCFIEPLDLLFLRGNKLFGDPGSFGESLIPPWPSAAAGALRSALLAHKGLDPLAFARGAVSDPELGTPGRPGPFTVTAFHLARRHRDGTVDPLLPVPADLVVAETEGGDRCARRIAPREPAAGIISSAPLPLLPVLPEPERAKPAGGWWLTAAGWAAHRDGRDIDPKAHLVNGESLWRRDTRVGVGLDPARRRADDGKLFTVEAVILRKREHGDNCDVGFVASVEGAELPEQLDLRLGGDGRGALARRLPESPLDEPDYAAIAAAGRCRLVLTAPGLFGTAPAPHGDAPPGWLPAGATADSGGAVRFELHGARGRIVCAAVPRAEVISGWDLAQRGPKSAQRAAPAGSVYWLEDLEATSEALRKLVGRGLWPEPEENPGRRAEGFNRVAVAAWSRS